MARIISGISNNGAFNGVNGGGQGITGSRVAPGDWQFQNQKNGNQIQMTYDSQAKPGHHWNETITTPNGKVYNRDGMHAFVHQTQSGDAVTWSGGHLA